MKTTTSKPAEAEERVSLRDRARIVVSDGERYVAQQPSMQNAAEWLTDFMKKNGGFVPVKMAIEEARRAGHEEYAINRVRQRMGIITRRYGYGNAGAWWWRDPNAICGDNS
jgi:hypothetical protein